MTPPTSASIRSGLVSSLRLDLVGPEPSSPLASETLDTAPSRWYLTGFLVPYEAQGDQAHDISSRDQLDLPGGGAGADDDDAPEPPSARRARLPSSIGVSLLVPAEVLSLDVTVEWGDYAYTPTGSDPPTHWQRTQRRAVRTVPLPKPTKKRTQTKIPDSGGLELSTTARSVKDGAAPGLPQGVRSVSVFLVNHRPPLDDERQDEAKIFQVALRVRVAAGITPRPNRRGLEGDDEDERVAELQYRDAYEYAVGHGVATTAIVDPDRVCREVATTWIPAADVERVEPGSVPGVELGMEALGAVESAADLRRMLAPLPERYDEWIAARAKQVPGDARGAETARQLLQQAATTRARIADGIEALQHSDVREAFRIANRAMAAAARQRESIEKKQPAADLPAPAWRPFQLAFLLLNLRGIADPRHADRSVVDLLFFPTGGGKTEAYLGLAAITVVLRRLRNPGVAGAGVSVLMRYTLRLLTLDQLARAAALLCALELEREKDIARLGRQAFEIGLWVGQAATPNRMGKAGDGNRESAYARTVSHKNNSKKPAPIPLENCPWCGTKFTADSFVLFPLNAKTPTDLNFLCASRRCPFNGRKRLPIIAVDEPIYRRLPCILIATVDKFAGLPWFGATGALFGKVDRYDDADCFYGPCDKNEGKRLEQPLLPLDLVIQDELHLISGPLGTMAGLYETAVDALCARQVDGVDVRPKIVASTATVRRAQVQIRALFARPRVEVFPPPGPDRRDSFFARTVPVEERPARRYVGVAAPGRSPKVILLRTYLALLGAAEKAWIAAGGTKADPNPADPYMTLLGYFTSLRELGGTRRIVEDEVCNRLAAYGSRMRVGEKQGLFANRTIAFDVVELTSREPTNKVADAKRRLALPFPLDDRIDVALATNMISVGLDIQRLGLMVVFGQPKTTAEYIQATSRVGRDSARPGLAVTLLNVHRPRDRSHFERFEAYHAAFYRAVEATSVTPFSPRAVDRGLAAVTVALARLGATALTGALQAGRITNHRKEADAWVDALAERAAGHDSRQSAQEAAELRARIAGRTRDLLDAWTRIADRHQEQGVPFTYNKTEHPEGKPLLRDPLDPDLLEASQAERKFKAHRSLRDVEPSVNLFVQNLDGTVPRDEEVDE